MSREITITFKIKDDKNYERYLEKIENAKKKIEDMKESGIINVYEIFKMGIETGIKLSKLEFEVIE